MIPELVKRSYLRLVDPVADWLVWRGVHPNTLTTLGALCSVLAGVIYASGHIRTGGWFLGLTALFDVLDGTVARRGGQASRFGAFYDPTLDRITDGAVLGGLAVYFASWSGPGGMAMVSVCVLAIIGSFVTSYTRARGESLGLDVREGVLQRPERVVLLSAPQAFFGLALNGVVLMGIITLLALTVWMTSAQRMLYVHRALARGNDSVPRSAQVALAPVLGAEVRPANTRGDP